MRRRSRRRFLQDGLVLANIGLLAGCGVLPRQLHPAPGTAKVPRLGWLGGSAEASSANTVAFRQGLRDLGYVEGQNITIDGRFSEGHDDQFSALAAELVGLPVDLIVTAGSPAGLAAKQATTVIPIVSVSGTPVESGLVTSLARPGGNVTGLSLGPLGGQLTKRLELLKAMIPEVSRVAILGNAGNPAHVLEPQRTQEVAQSLGIQMLEAPVQRPEDLESVADGVTGAGAQAILVQNDPLMSALRPRILEFASRKRLPLASGERIFVEGGGLMGYGVSQASVYRRAATYVDKILKGANPSDLPIEQPTKFDFVVNLKTAQALGLTIPSSVLQQATEIIQ